MCAPLSDQLTVFVWVCIWTLFCSIDLFVYKFFFCYLLCNKNKEGLQEDDVVITHNVEHRELHSFAYWEGKQKLRWEQMETSDRREDSGRVFPEFKWIQLFPDGLSLGNCHNLHMHIHHHCLCILKNYENGRKAKGKKALILESTSAWRKFLVKCFRALSIMLNCSTCFSNVCWRIYLWFYCWFWDKRYSGWQNEDIKLLWPYGTADPNILTPGTSFMEDYHIFSQTK